MRRALAASVVVLIASIGAIAACASNRSAARRVPATIRQNDAEEALAVRARGGLAFVSERGGTPQVYRLDQGAQVARPVARVEGSGFIGPIGPHDELLVVSSTGHEATALEQLHLFANDTLTPLGNASRFVRNPTWLADGRSVVYETDQNGFRNLFRVRLPGSAAPLPPEQLTRCEQGCFEPSAAPTGEQIAYASPDSGDGEIYTLDLESGDSRRLTWSKGTDRAPAWSPDGQRIAFVSSRHGAPRAFVMGSDGSKPHPLRASVEDDIMAERDMVWSPNGELVAFVVQRPGRASLQIVRVHDGAIVGATDGAWLDQNPSFSVDSDHVAFTSDRAGNPDIYTMRTDGSDLRRVTDDAAPDWLPRWTH